MRKVFAIALALLLVTSSTFAQDARWKTTGVQTFTVGGAGTVLSDSGPITGDAVHEMQWIIAAAQVQAVVVLQHRNAANDTTLTSQILPLSAFSQFTIPMVIKISMLDGERLRIILNNNITGSVQASMFFE